MKSYPFARPVKSLFDDSSHHLWLLEGKSGEKSFLKFASHASAEQSLFWQRMQLFFGVSFPDSVRNYQRLYPLVERLCGLKVPKVLDCGAEAPVGGWVLCQYLPGRVCGSETEIPSGRMLNTMISSIENLYLNDQAFHATAIGDLLQPEISVEGWISFLIKRLESSLQSESERQVWSKVRRRMAGVAAEPGRLVPIMIDWRWDQFLVCAEEVTLVDLDAWVWAPEELAWVLFELVWSESELDVLKSVCGDRVPVIGPWRDLYRLMLYQMEILGKVDLLEWMSRSTYFE
ncbi:hypothetical protein [Thiomicrorhabdus sp.]|uniref:hypothetical protein n=1 Tax=Thiomicrorhabdus sp. TaxID=2039724 RepID=UPI0029C8266C|nr:hypothetical protein [Thiomicrorhabdus sp.]